jgi:hypothetical protein
MSDLNPPPSSKEDVLEIIKTMDAIPSIQATVQEIQQLLEVQEHHPGKSPHVSSIENLLNILPSSLLKEVRKELQSEKKKTPTPWWQSQNPDTLPPLPKDFFPDI